MSTATAKLAHASGRSPYKGADSSTMPTFFCCSLLLLYLSFLFFLPLLSFSSLFLGRESVWEYGKKNRLPAKKDAAGAYLRAFSDPNVAARLNPGRARHRARKLRVQTDPSRADNGCNAPQPQPAQIAQTPRYSHAYIQRFVF